MGLTYQTDLTPAHVHEEDSLCSCSWQPGCAGGSGAGPDGRSSLPDVPLDVLHTRILPLLPPGTLTNLRVVSKRWRDWVDTCLAGTEQPWNLLLPPEAAHTAQGRGLLSSYPSATSVRLWMGCEPPVRPQPLSALPSGSRDVRWPSPPGSLPARKSARRAALVCSPLAALSRFMGALRCLPVSARYKEALLPAADATPSRHGRAGGPTLGGLQPTPPGASLLALLPSLGPGLSRVTSLSLVMPYDVTSEVRRAAPADGPAWRPGAQPPAKGGARALCRGAVFVACHHSRDAPCVCVRVSPLA
jgi:hypothetical protein